MGYEIAPKRGVKAHYGPRVNIDNLGGDHGSKSRVKTAKWVITYAELNADFASVDLGASGAYAIPAGAVITSAMINVTEAFDGTAQTMSVGLENSAGTAIDADGIDVTVDVTALGSTACDGALVGATIGEADGYLAVVGAAADSTVGSCEIIVEYMY